MATLRKALPQDEPALQALIAESVRGLSRGYYSPQQVESALLHVFGPDSQLHEVSSHEQFPPVGSEARLATDGTRPGQCPPGNFPGEPIFKLSCIPAKRTGGTRAKGAGNDDDYRRVMARFCSLRDALRKR